MIYNTGNTLHSAIQFLHAMNLSEDNTLACLQTVWSVVHAGNHPRVALQLQDKTREKNVWFFYQRKNNETEVQITCFSLLKWRICMFIRTFNSIIKNYYEITGVYKSKECWGFKKYLVYLSDILNEKLLGLLSCGVWHHKLVSKITKDPHTNAKCITADKLLKTKVVTALSSALTTVDWRFFICNTSYWQSKTAYSDGGLLWVAKVIHSLLQADSGFSQNNTLEERGEQVVGY